MNQLLGQQDTPCLRDRDGGRTEMLSKQAPELSLSDAQALGQAIDTRLIECACVDQRQRPGHRVRRPAPGGKLGRRLRPTSQAGTEARFLRRRCCRIERHVLAFRHARRADRTAIDPGCPDPGEQPPVEARVASAERAITRINVEIHDQSLLRSCGMSSGFRTSPTSRCRADAIEDAEPCMAQSSQRRIFADHDRTRRSLDNARQNRRTTPVPFGRLTLRAVRASSLMHSNGWTTRWLPCWPTPASVERIWMTRTRAYRLRSGHQCFAERWNSAR